MSKKRLTPEKGPKKMKLYDEASDRKKGGYSKPDKGSKRMK